MSCVPMSCVCVCVCVCVFVCMQKAKDGEVDAELSQLYLNASRRSRDAIAEEFQLPTPLYFSYTHLVCRTSKESMLYIHPYI